MNDLERIARELALSDGYYPDDHVIQQPMPAGPRGLPVLYANNQPVPVWSLYEPYVRAVLTMLVTGSEGTDMRELITDILKGEDIAEAPEPENKTPAPPANWRDRYHLQPIKN